MGFAYLKPPFSIRCVEVSDDQVPLVEEKSASLRCLLSPLQGRQLGSSEPHETVPHSPAGEQSGLAEGAHGLKLLWASALLVPSSLLGGVVGDTY